MMKKRERRQILIFIISLLSLFWAFSVSSTPVEKENLHFFEKYFIEEDINVIFTDEKIINTWWKLIGGQKDWEKVHAFTYYDHKQNVFYIVLPKNASFNLIGYEFNHILEWKKNGKINNTSSKPLPAEKQPATSNKQSPSSTFSANYLNQD